MKSTPPPSRRQAMIAVIGRAWNRLTQISHKWQPWTTIALGGFFLGNVAARTWDSAGEFLVHAATVGWITAIATFAAAVVAFNIALRNEARQRLADEERATILAANHRDLLGVLLLDTASLRARFPDVCTDLTATPEQHYPEIARDLANIRLKLAAIEIEALAAFDAELVAMLISTRGQVDVALALCGQEKCIPQTAFILDKNKERIVAAQKIVEGAYIRHVGGHLAKMVQPSAPSEPTRIGVSGGYPQPPALSPRSTA